MKNIIPNKLEKKLKLALKQTETTTNQINYILSRFGENKQNKQKDKIHLTHKEIVHKILSGSKKPLNFKEITKRFNTKGRGTTDNTIRTLLYTNKQFKTVKRGVWTLNKELVSAK